MQDISEFIERWAASGGNERGNYALFLSELTDVLGLEKPLPATATTENDSYRFERPVKFSTAGTNSTTFIDLYRKGSFILEAKQGVKKPGRDDRSQLSLLSETDAPSARQGHGVRGSRQWDKALISARHQADRYARAVAKDDGWPPFLIICDVGYIFELYADFSRQGQGYTQFPDKNRYRIELEQLADPEIQELFRTIWTDPYALDPSKRSARVTREIADQLALLGRSFEKQGHDSERVAGFLMRCLFSMFAEDVELIPRDSFTDLLKDMAKDPGNAHHALKSLWATMDTGGWSGELRTALIRFNGGLFADSEALPLDSQQIALLIGAAGKDWKEVEPAIFGTLLERALDKRQRHKLGAHYTPRAYVERLVTPTVMEPLREDWRNVQAAAWTLANQGKMKEARAEVHAFHRSLCEVRVLDPACGSGNFLYVALELMKRLEGEVTSMLTDLGEAQDALGLEGYTVDPHQFLGIEVNPWAAKVAELVLWIGYLQWHFRTHGKATPAEPVLRDFHNIENRDAVLDYGETTPRVDAAGKPVTRWDGTTTKPHPVTGEEVPDADARVQALDYAKPKPAKWPEAEFIVGNPPFIGASRMRDALGDGYAEALWKAYPKMPQSADFVMFWWEKAALAARGWSAKTGKGTRRFGLITTNSLRQTFNRRVLEPHLAAKKPLSLIFAVPDHPWVDAGQGAAVRIAMTVAEAGAREGRLLTIAEEIKGEEEAEGRVVRFREEDGKVFANLRTGADVTGAVPLKANDKLSSQGVKLHGKGFLIEENTALRFGLKPGEDTELLIRPFSNGMDIARHDRGLYTIDVFDYGIEKLRDKFPQIYQHILDNVKPQRDSNKRDHRRVNWWLYGDRFDDLRNSIDSLERHIVTVRTSRYRYFVFKDFPHLPESGLVGIGLDGGDKLSVLSSKAHTLFQLATCGWLGVGNDPTYNNSICFDKFPFPSPTDAQKARLSDLGERLDAHRKARQAEHPKLTLTQMYNVLEKLRAEEELTDKDRDIYDKGLIGILKQLHDDIDAAVAEAYGWPADLPDDDILHRLVALNKERAAEEAKGHIRWLRPDYQNPDGKVAEAKGKTAEMDLAETDVVEKSPWPKRMPDQIAAVRAALDLMGEGSSEQIARTFQRARTSTVQPLLDSLAALGAAEVTEAGRYVSTR